MRWQKSKFDENERFECIDINEEKYFGSCLDPESPKLVITKTTFEDMPYYRLLIWNKIGEHYSNTTHLNVTGSMAFAVSIITIYIFNNYCSIVYLSSTCNCKNESCFVVGAPHVSTGHEIKDIVKPWSLRLIGKVFVYDQSPTIDTFYWTKDGKKIKNLEGGDKYSEGSTEDPSLFIQNVNPHDVGTYRLTAINAVGSNESNIVLGK